MKIKSIVISIIFAFASLLAFAGADFGINHCQHDVSNMQAMDMSTSTSECDSEDTACDMDMAGCQTSGTAFLPLSFDRFTLQHNSFTFNSYAFRLNDYDPPSDLIPPIA